MLALLAPFIDKSSHTIRFVTTEESAKIDELLNDRDLCLTFADNKKMIFASVSGRGQVTDDKDLIKSLWGPYCEAFFPDGPDSVVVITVTASQAEYWDNDKGSLSIAFEVTKVYFGDQGPDPGARSSR